MRRIIFTLLLLPCLAFARISEREYQSAFCEGKTEVILSDNSRVDCLTKEEAIEFDFSYKWAESIGQALLYSKLTGKIPTVYLIVNEKSNRHIERFLIASQGLGIRLYLLEEFLDEETFRSTINDKSFNRMHFIRAINNSSSTLNDHSGY